MHLALKTQKMTSVVCKGILFIFFSVLTINAFPQSYNFRNFNTEDGLTQSYVYSILQDVQGYLWVGTDNGLFRYNGFEFENYPTGNSLADNFITCSVSDDKWPWFGFSNGRVLYFDGQKLKPANLTQNDLTSITHLAKSPDNQIWASTYSDGLLKLSRDSSAVKRYQFGERTTIISFDFLNDTELLAGTNTGLLYCRLTESGEIEKIRSVLEIPESKVTCIHKMRNESGFYIATENDGIFQMTTRDNQFKISKIIADTDFEFTGIEDIYEDSQAKLWLCSKGQGLIKTSFTASGKLTLINIFNKPNGFVTDNVKTVFEDREGNIWSGNFGQGLTLITPKSFSVYKVENPVYGNNIFSIYVNGQDRWIGTENGLIKMDQLTSRIVKFYGIGSGLPKDTVTTIYSNDGKNLWIGTGRNGVFRMDTEHEGIVKYPVENGVLENSITIITGKGEQVWIGTKKGLWNIDSGTNRKNWFSISQGGLPHNSINCLYIDSTDKLWVSTPGSTLAYIQDEKVFKIPLNSPGGNLTLGPITEDLNSGIWVGSNGNGVFKIQADSIANLTVKEGLLFNFCYSVICDDQNNIWVGHKGGLSRIRTTDFSIKPIRNIDGITDSYQFNSNAIIKDQQGKIWFGSDRGMVSYDPSSDPPQLQPPVLGITSIKINDVEIDYTDKIILSPGFYKVRVDFLGISLKEPALVNYQYKLEGYDQWSEITKNTFVTYPRLTAGDYTFIVKANNGDGTVTESPLTIRIIIKVPVWGKWWFYPLNVLLLFILTFGYIKRREYIFLAEKRVLEEKVLERTYEIQCQKNELELQRDLIDEKNASITSSIRYASNIQNAVFPPVELIDKLLPDSFILSKPKDIVSGDFYWLAEKDNKIVIVLADCTGHGVPGAFMSLLGITLLNDIVNIEGITRSDAIVTKLRERVTHSLQQGRKDIPTTDGLDIALCVLDLQRHRLQFSGGMHNIVLIRDKKLEEVKADRFSVCVISDSAGPFTMKEIECRKGDVLYLFSDGYQDQFGGDFNKKFLRTHFYMILLEIHELPMSKQREILEYRLIEWMNDKIQTDDITVMGIRL